MSSILGLPPRAPTPTNASSSSLPPRMPTPTGSAGGGGSVVSGGGGSPAKTNSPSKNAHSPQMVIDPGGGSSSRNNSRSNSPFFGIVMPTPSFERLLRPEGGGGSGGSSGGGSGGGGRDAASISSRRQEPPPMPLTSVDAAAGGGGVGGVDGRPNAKHGHGRSGSGGSAASSKSRRRNNRGATPLPPHRDPLLPLSYSTEYPSAGGHPPPLMSLPTQEAEGVLGAGGLCGGLYCEGPFPRGASVDGASADGRGAGTLVIGCCDSDEGVGGVGGGNVGLNGAMLLAIAEKVDVEPYAERHDEIVTALIDEALRGSRNGGGNDDDDGDDDAAEAVAASSPATATTVEESQPPPLIEMKERGDEAGAPSVAPSDASCHANTNRMGRSKPRSPYRMTRNISKLSTSGIKLRKRQRNAKRDGDGDAASVRSKKSTNSSPPSKQQSMTLKLNSASGSRNSTPVKDRTAIQESPSSSSIPTNNTNNTFGNFGTARTPTDYFHPQCVLHKENPKQKSKMPGFGGGRGKDNCEEDGAAPSAVGKEETLEKLNKKLSMLGDIESGKFGRAAEMLRSDAVAFALRGGAEERPDDDESTRAARLAESPITGVETRSILTLRMGFVSMSYGILLQWDCASQMVELIVLRKMCRDDFLKRPRHDRAVDRSYRSAAGGGGGRAGGPAQSPPKRTPQKLPPKPALIPVPERPGGGGSDHSIDVEVKPLSPSPDVERPGVVEGGAGTGTRGRLSFPRLSLPPNPLAGLPRLLGGLVSPPDRPQSFLCVSVLEVRQLHGGCDRCRARNMGGLWSSIKGKNGKNGGGRRASAQQGKGTSGYHNTGYHNNNPHAPGNSRYHHKHRRLKRKQTIRPYIRFVLGRHEHCTKITKFDHGHPVWTKRHHNSCILPCPPDEVSWFAGQEDLIVEVRNNWKMPGRVNVGAAVKVSSSWQSHGKGLFGSKSSEDDLNVRNQLVASSSNDDPILAAVTVPLSSVNIEDEDETNSNNNSFSDGTDGEGGGGKIKRRTKTKKDGASSTNITIPLRMSSCSHAPMGSISLKITIKVPPTPSADGNAAVSPARANGAPRASNNALSLPSFNVDLSGLQVDINISGGSGSNNGEPKVNESIELGPLTRLMDSWSLGGGSGSKDQLAVSTAATKEKDRGRETTEAAVAAGRGRKKSKSPRRSRSFSPRRSRGSRGANADGVGGKPKKRKRLRWSKQFDHQTKKWSNLKTPNNATTTAGGDGDGANVGRSESPSRSPSSKKQEEGNATTNQEGWFAFLTRESTRDVAAGNAAAG